MKEGREVASPDRSRKSRFSFLLSFFFCLQARGQKMLNFWITKKRLFPLHLPNAQKKNDEEDEEA